VTGPMVEMLLEGMPKLASVFELEPYCPASAPFTRSVVESMKPLPLRVRIKFGVPAVTEVGKM